MLFIKKYWVAVLIICLLLGIFTKLSFGSFELSSRLVSEVVDGVIVETTYYVRDLKHPIADMISDVLISFSFALLIALAFIRSMEASDKRKFENRLLEFQKSTARDAISSSFERLIDKEFFEIIKSDILTAKFQRHDLRWHYDIESDAVGNTMILTRTISYVLKNISQSAQTEHIYLATFADIHSSSEKVAVKCKIDGQSEFVDLSLDDDKSDGTLINSNEEVVVPAGKSAEVVLIFRQVFPRNYIYETHFLNHGGINLELTVSMPKGFQFSINPTVLKGRTETLVDEDTKKVFRISGAIYRGQGIEFMCFKNEHEKQLGTS